MNVEILIPLLAAAVQSGTPILYATLGEIFTERSGILNLGVEGTMIIGALTGFLVGIGLTLLLASIPAISGFIQADFSLGLFGQALIIALSQTAMIGLAAWQVRAGDITLGSGIAVVGVEQGPVGDTPVRTQVPDI